MKKVFNYIILGLILLIIKCDCFASTTTFERTPSNLRVPNDIVVDNNSINKILATPSVSSSEKIYDFAKLLSEKEEKAIFESINNYNKMSNFDCAIVTTNDLLGFNINEYTYNFYDFNYFKSDGVIFVIYVKDDYSEIFMGTSGRQNSKVFSIYDEAMINSTLRYLFENSIKEKKYNEACVNFVKIVDGFYQKKEKGEYHVTSTGKIVKRIPFIEITILSAAITFIITIILVMKSDTNRKKDFDLDSHIDKNSLIIKLLYDNLIDTSIK